MQITVRSDGCLSRHRFKWDFVPLYLLEDAGFRGPVLDALESRGALFAWENNSLCIESCRILQRPAVGPDATCPWCVLVLGSKKKMQGYKLSALGQMRLLFVHRFQ